MAAPVRTPPFLLDERNGRIFPFDAILAKHRAMKPHYQPPKLAPVAEPRMYHEPVLPTGEQPHKKLEAERASSTDELVVEEPEAPVKLNAPVAAAKPDGRSKAARAARAAKNAEPPVEAPKLSVPAPTDNIDDILDGLDSE